MKKIFTLLVCATMATVSFAQEASVNRDFARNENVSFRDRHGRDEYRKAGNFYYFSKRELQMQIADINQEYESKICNVKDRWFTSSYKKQRAIRQLERERDLKIAQLNERFRSKFNKFNYQHWNNW